MGKKQKKSNRRKKMNKRGVPIRLFLVFMFFICSVFVFLPVSAFSACPETMTSYWKLDGELNEPYLNEIDLDFDGLCRASGTCPTATTSGAVGDGAQQFAYLRQAQASISLASAASTAPFDWAAGDSFTIEVWTKRVSGITGTEVVIGRNISPTKLHWYIGLKGVGGGEGVAEFILLDAGGSGTFIIGTTNIADNDWHHIMAVKDASQDKILLYVDGKLDGSADFDYSLGTGFKSSTANMNIGWINLSPFYSFNGGIDEIAIYDVALPQRIAERHFILGKPYCEVSAPGVFRKGGWYLDANGTGQWEKGLDTAISPGSFGFSTDIPITGDWNGDGYTYIGVFRNGAWYLDTNGNGQWNSGVDTAIPAGSFGLPTDIPITGDWNGSGTTKIGVFRKGAWYLDLNGNGQWNSGVDTAIPAGSFGIGDRYSITGDWNGDGITKIGVFRNGAWYLDTNGNGQWNSGWIQLFLQDLSGW
jgi:hypothetical protein